MYFSPHGGSNHIFGNSAVMVRFDMDLLGTSQNLIGIGQPVVVLRSIKVVTHCDTFKAQIFAAASKRKPMFKEIECFSIFRVDLGW